MQAPLAVVAQIVTGETSGWSLNHMVASRTMMIQSPLQATLLAIPDLICFGAFSNNLAAARTLHLHRWMPASGQLLICQFCQFLDDQRRSSSIVLSCMRLAGDYDPKVRDRDLIQLLPSVGSVVVVSLAIKPSEEFHCTDIFHKVIGDLDTVSSTGGQDLPDIKIRIVDHDSPTNEQIMDRRPSVCKRWRVGELLDAYAMFLEGSFTDLNGWLDEAAAEDLPFS
jgi:hypothetical protein